MPVFKLRPNSVEINTQEVAKGTLIIRRSSSGSAEIIGLPLFNVVMTYENTSFDGYTPVDNDDMNRLLSLYLF